MYNLYIRSLTSKSCLESVTECYNRREIHEAINVLQNEKKVSIHFIYSMLFFSKVFYKFVTYTMKTKRSPKLPPFV